MATFISRALPPYFVPSTVTSKTARTSCKSAIYPKAQSSFKICVYWHKKLRHSRNISIIHSILKTLARTQSHSCLNRRVCSSHSPRSIHHGTVLSRLHQYIRWFNLLHFGGYSVSMSACAPTKGHGDYSTSVTLETCTRSYQR